VKSHFSYAPNLLYFNSANLSICPNSVLDAIETYRREFEKNPTQSLKKAWSWLWETQTLLAAFLGANPKDLLLRTNVTEVLNTFILGYPMRTSDEILIGELEYGAISNICRFRANRDSLNVRILKIPQSQIAFSKLTAERLIEDILSQISPRTRMIVLSHVVASLGLRIPIEKIASHTKSQNIALIIDGAYAPGALPVNFSSLNEIDFYGCSLYKWLLGPKGTAFGWVNSKHQESLAPLLAGWTTFETGGVFAEFGGGSRFQEKFKLLGCRDFSPFYALKELLKFWNSIGIEVIQNRIAQLNRFFQQLMAAELGWPFLLANDPSLHSPMTVFRVPEKLQARGETLSDWILSQVGIQIHFTFLNTGWHGVFSPHIYNSELEIEIAVSRLKKIL
jgi:isopenicillin-N epimerase